MSGYPKTQHSMETILTFENGNISQWSAVWSTANIPSAAGGVTPGVHRQAAGRLRLRLASLSLGAFLAMHCKVAAAALTGGYFIFVLFLIASVVALANPLRHFEVYLGQWSISGPGRAFHIIPILDGIGIAVCINALVRAITYCSVAAISAVYLIQSVSDEALPFTYCRNFQLKSYKPYLKEIKQKRFYDTQSSNIVNDIIFQDWRRYELSKLANKPSATSVELSDHAWRKSVLRQEIHPKIEVCNETYDGRYPALFNTPAYNYFYVEVVHLRPDHSLLSFNTKLIWNIIGAWSIIWIILIGERIAYGKLVWNKTNRWMVVIPWIWVGTLIAVAIGHFTLMKYKLKHAFRIGFGAKETLGAIADALDVAIYIHAAGLGTELVHGKGLNHYASGHIDPFLNNDNVWHSVILLFLAALHSGGASACAFVDYLQFEVEQSIKHLRESTLWIIPMYSKCVSQGNHSHLASSILFGGLTLCYLAVAFTLIKTVLHTIFEYKIQLIYVEQTVVTFVMIFCMASSLFFASNGGIVFLESVESLMTTVATPLVVLLELMALLYVYRSHDFQSDMNLATEENAWGSRLATQWQMIPFITLALLVLKIYMLTNTELPTNMVLLALLPLLAVVAAVPLRAAHNIYQFLGSRRTEST